MAIYKHNLKFNTILYFKKILKTATLKPYLTRTLPLQIEPKKCPQGYFCPEKTGIDWVPCERGTFGAKSGLIDQDGRLMGSQLV